LPKKSFDTKQNVNHALYEEQRLPNTSAAKQAELAQKMKKNSDAIPKPNGVENIKSFP
jgi:hypothetical protein